MKKNILLASYFAEISELFFESIKEKINGQKVTFIPTASINEEVTFYVDDGKEALQRAGLTIEELDISKAENKELLETINRNEIIYVSGGNSFFLLKELKRTGADNIIRDQVNSGKLFIGESAGAIVLSPNIEYIKDMDDYTTVEGLNSYDSLNMVDFYPLPHYKDFPFQECTEKIVSEFTGKINLYPFNNTQAIIVNGTKVRLLEK